MLLSDGSAPCVIDHSGCRRRIAPGINVAAAIRPCAEQPRPVLKLRFSGEHGGKKPLQFVQGLL